MFIPTSLPAQSTNNVEGQKEAALLILREARHWAMRLDPAAPQGERDLMLREISLAQAKGAMPYDALETTRDVVSPYYRSQLLAAIGRAFAQEGDFQQATQLAKESDELCAKIKMLMCGGHSVGYQVLKKRIERGEYEEAAKIGYPASTVMYLRGLQEVASGNLEAAFTTARRIDKSWEKGQILQSIIASQTEARDFAAASETAKQLEPNDRLHIEDNIKSWRIAAAIRNGDWQAAHHTAEQLIWRRLETFLKIAEAEAAAGLIDESKQTFARAADEHRAYVQRHPSMRLDDIGKGWGEIVAAELRAGFRPVSRIDAEAFSAETGNSEAWCLIGSAQARLGDLEAARATNDRAGGPWCIFTVLAEEEAKRGNPEGAIQTLLLHAWEPAKHNALSHLVEKLADAGNVEAARIVADRLALIEAELRPVESGIRRPDLTVEQVSEQEEEEEMARLELERRYHHYAVRLVARAWARPGNIDEASAWARAQDSPKCIASALLGIAEGIVGKAD